jgi:hypothetical protein
MIYINLPYYLNIFSTLRMNKKNTMQVKGTSIKTTRDFVKIKFPNRFDEWIKSLPKESQTLYSDSVKVGDWFDIKTAYYEPMNKIIELFYNNNAQKGGEDLGLYSAEIALNGIYKVFLLVATPQYLMKRASRMIETFYTPCVVDVSEVVNKSSVMTIKKFEGITKTLEYRFAGWVSKALELCKCKNISYKITSHISAGQPTTVLEFKWE